MRYLIITLFVSQFASMALAGPKTTIGQKWPVADQVSMDRINHQPWDQLLKKYVDATGNVNYTAWNQASADRQLLTAYLHHLSRASRSLPASKPAQLAFWINAYNAVTVEGILRVYPTTSIRNHTAKIYGYNIWHDLLLQVGAEASSLDQIEHKILRPLKEPRIHFAIVCASHSCPRLRNEAYTAAQLEQQLQDNSQVFFANRENFSYNPSTKTVVLSSILKWFAEDFGSNQTAQLKTITPYLSPATAQFIQSGNVTISYADYDWSLNDQKTAGKR